MSGVQVTPRKRAVNNLKRAHNAPSPNPPLAPFPPTPPSTRRRRIAEVDEDEDELADLPNKRPYLGPRTNLPTHLQTLLTLHHAFNIALSLHIAQNPPILPAHSATATRVQLPNLTTMLALKGMVERSSGRRFGKEELARLAWLWTWDGETLPAESSKTKEDDNPFLVPKAKVESVCGLSYLITTTRTLDPAGRKVHTHGIGIELEVQPGETRRLFLDGGAGALNSGGQGGGVRVVGRWNAGSDMREDEVRRRLERWVELNGGEVEPTQSSHLPTPSTRDSSRSSIPPIPLLPLPKLPVASTSTATLFSMASDSSSTTTPKKPTLMGLSDPFEIKEKKVTPAGTAEERKNALFARIKARSEKPKTLGESIQAGSSVIHRAARPVEAEDLRRRATLSRLESVAEAVWMMFSAPQPGSASGTPRARRRALLLSEVAETVVQSSKTPISTAEAETSLQMLIDLCPFFLASKKVGRHDWLEMKAEPPSSPGASVLSSPGAAIGGPASPGRVRRGGGLREVRERIRRELGE